MNSDPLLAGVVGALISVGIVLFVLSFLGYQVFPDRSTSQRRQQVSDSASWSRVVAAAVTFLLALLLVGHPVFAVTAAIGAFTVWGQLGSKKQTKAFIAKENAAVVWMEAVASALKHSHMNVAIQSAGDYAEPEIRAHAQELARNLQTMELHDAMAIFAERMQSRPIDSVAAVLTLVASHGGRKVSELILLEADQARQRTAAIAEIAQAQSADRVSVRQVLGVTIVMALGVPLISENVMSWYDTSQGYIAMTIVGAGFIWCLNYMIRLSRVPPEPRFFFGSGTVDPSSQNVDIGAGVPQEVRL